MWCWIFPPGVPVPLQCFLRPLTPPGFAAPLGTATALANRGHDVAFIECPAKSRRKRWSRWALLGMGMSLGPAGRSRLLRYRSGLTEQCRRGRTRARVSDRPQLVPGRVEELAEGCRASRRVGPAVQPHPPSLLCFISYFTCS